MIAGLIGEQLKQKYQISLHMLIMAQRKQIRIRLNNIKISPRNIKITREQDLDKMSKI